MTKTEMIKAMAERKITLASRGESVEHKLTLAQAGEIYDILFDIENGVITTGLLSDGEVKIPEFGKLSLVEKAERQCRNPQTGETMVVPAKNTVKFKAFDSLKSYIN